MQTKPALHSRGPRFKLAIVAPFGLLRGLPSRLSAGPASVAGHLLGRLLRMTNPAAPKPIRRLVEIELSKSNPLQRPQVLSTAKQSAARAAEPARKTADREKKR